VHKGGGLAVVEDHHLAGDFVHLGVGADAALGDPRLGTKLLERHWIESVDVTAHPKRRQRLAAVHDHVGAGGVLHAAARPPAIGAKRVGRHVEHSRPQRAGSLLLGDEAGGADEPVSIGRLAVGEVQLVQHAVAIKGVIEPDGLVHRVLRVAQVDPLEIGGDLALDDDEVGRVPLREVRLPGAGPVGVIVTLGKG